VFLVAIQHQHASTLAQHSTPTSTKTNPTGVGFSRLSIDGAIDGTPIRATHYGQGPADAPLAPSGYRRWGDRSAADVMGGRVYLAVPYALTPAGSRSSGWGGTWIAMVDDAAA